MDKMFPTSPVLQLLGEENIEYARREIANILIERIRDDFTSWDRYLFYPPDYEEWIEEIFDECKAEIKEVVKTKLLDEAMSILGGDTKQWDLA